ncbi:MAG TPA: NIPSNAP family protein [Sphingobacteriaceae bacterium]
MGKLILSLFSAFLMLTFLPESDNNSFQTKRMDMANQVIEIRSYNLKAGTRDKFHQLVINESMPLLKKWKMAVVSFGPSLHDENSYYLVRSFRSLEDRQKDEDAFYNSDDWVKGPRERILALIENYTTIVLPSSSFGEWDSKMK